MVNMNNLMKQAQAMQKKLMEAKDELAAKEYSGTAGGEMVVVTLYGSGEAKSVKIDPELMNKDEIEMLEDLIVTAFKNAKKKLDEDSKNSMSGLLPPGLDIPF